MLSTTITLTTEATHSLGDLRLFVGVAEDTINYTSPNGEPVHYNVFRKALTPITGSLVTIPANVGESVSFDYTVPAHADWDFSRIFTMAILQQDSNKEVVQANAVPASQNDVMDNTLEQELLGQLDVFPNPASDVLQVTVGNTNQYKGVIYSITGQKLMEKDFSGQIIFDVKSLEPGTYFLEIRDESVRIVEKIIVQ